MGFKNFQVSGQKWSILDHNDLTPRPCNKDQFLHFQTFKLLQVIIIIIFTFNQLPKKYVHRYIKKT